MIVYNETVIVDEAIHQQWLSWMEREYIPRVMATGCFDNFTILKVLDSPNEGVTYCVQYLTENRDNHRKFIQDHQQSLQAAHMQQFENQVVLFSTLMQTVNK
jgi:hypothetical protein